MARALSVLLLLSFLAGTSGCTVAFGVGGAISARSYNARLDERPPAPPAVPPPHRSVARSTVGWALVGAAIDVALIAILASRLDDCWTPAPGGCEQ